MSEAADVTNVVEENNEVQAEIEEPIEESINLDDVFSQVKPEDVLERPELSKLIQSRIDSTVTKALTTARGKWESELNDNLDEAKKLEKMTAEQREKYQLEKEKRAFEAEKNEFEKQRLITATGSELLKRNLDPSFANYCVGKDAAESISNIEKFEKVFNDAVSTALNKRMKGEVPKDKQASNSITKETIKNMTPSEINQNWDAVKKVLREG